MQTCQLIAIQIIYIPLTIVDVDLIISNLNHPLWVLNNCLLNGNQRIITLFFPGENMKLND